jgi:hypothetical protein
MLALCTHGVTPAACPMCLAGAAARAECLASLDRLLNTTAAGEPWFTPKVLLHATPPLCHTSTQENPQQ